MRQHRFASLIFTLFILLGILYSLSTPIFEASDELHHYPVVAHIAEGNGLPVQDAGERTLWQQEGSQPPLYYLFSAALTFWIDTSDLSERLYKNPHALIGIPLGRENKNMVIHTEAEAFPWQQTTLAVHLIRLFSILLSSLTVLCTYRIGLELFPKEPNIALGAMALNAFIPMFLFISASVNNDNLVVLLSSFTLLLLIRHLKYGSTRTQLVLLGSIIGLACLTKLSALGLIPLAGLTVGLRQILSRNDDGSEERLPNKKTLSFWRMAQHLTIDLFVLFIPTLLISGWWYLRNWRLYGDPLGLNMMLDITGRRESTPNWETLLNEFEGFRINFWGLFGGVNILIYPSWIYLLLDSFLIIAFVGLVVWGWRQWRRQSLTVRAGLFICACWILVEMVALIRWTRMTYASQGRLIFPTLSALSLLLLLGIHSLLPTRYQGKGQKLITILFFALAVSVPFTAIRPAYVHPIILAQTDVPESLQPYPITYISHNNEETQLLAYAVHQPEIQAGELLPVTTCWQALTPMSQDYSFFFQLIQPDGRVLGQRDTFPGSGGYSTRLWNSGEVLCDTIDLSINAQLRGPTTALVEVGMYDPYRRYALPPFIGIDEQGNALEHTYLAQVKVASPSQIAQPATPLDVNLGHRVQLLGYTMDERPLRSSDTIPITLYWSVLGEMNIDYTIFIHLLNSQKEIRGQGDGPPMSGNYPTSFWSTNEKLADSHDIIVQEALTPGSYEIIVGLYDPKTGQRLPVMDENGEIIADQINLTNLEMMAE